jgi:hypothetical protein
MSASRGFFELFRPALVAVIFCGSLGGCARRAGLQQYAGRWVLESSGKNMMLLTIEVHHARIKGTLTMPKHHTEDGTGEFTGISLPMETLPVTGKWKVTSVELLIGSKPDRNKLPMTLPDARHAWLGYYHSVVPDWKFERVAAGQEVAVATDWPAYDLDPEIVNIRQQLRTMAEEDAAARQKKWFDPNETDEISERDGPFLETIFARYGWPKISVFDVIACDDFWLLVQHQSPPVQERMLPAMKTAVDAGEASKANYAYLFDRVQVGEGRPQHWGTQSSCENGRAILSPVDDMTNIDTRRKEVGLGTLADSIKGTDAVCSHVRQ